MADSYSEIRADTENQRDAGNRHLEQSDYLASIPSNHEEIVAWARSLGPIHKDFADELETLLQDRRGFYNDASAGEDQLGTGLHNTAALWDDHEDRGSAELNAASPLDNPLPGPQGPRPVPDDPFPTLPPEQQWPASPGDANHPPQAGYGATMPPEFNADTAPRPSE